MEQELFEGLKKSRNWALEVLCQDHLKRCWFLCCRLAGDTAGGAPLLIASLKAALGRVKEMTESPKEDLQELLSMEILTQYQKGLEPSEEFQALPPPQVAREYRPLVDEVEQLPPASRPYYWMYAYGGLKSEQISQAVGMEEEKLQGMIQHCEERLAQRRVQWDKPQRAAYIRLTTQLRDGGGNGFSQVQLSDTLLTTLWKEVGLPVKPAKKKEKKPWTRKRLTTLGVAVGVIALLIAAGVLALILMI